MSALSVETDRIPIVFCLYIKFMFVVKNQRNSGQNLDWYNSEALYLSDRENEPAIVKYVE